MFNYNSRKYRPAALIEIMESIFVSQTEYMSDSEYLENFRTRMDVLKSAGGDLCVHPGMVQDELDKTDVGPAAQASDTELANATLAARGRMEGALFLAKSCQQKYRPLVQDLANDFNKGHDLYPATLTAAYELMLHDVRGSGSGLASQGNSGVAFSTVGASEGQSDTPATNTQPNPRPDVTCHKCNKVGHFSSRCAEVSHADGTVLCTMLGEVVDVNSPGEEVTMAHFGSVEHDDDNSDSYGSEHGFSFVNDGAVVVEKCFDGKLFEQHKTATGRGVPHSWILLDNQSTVDVFCNKRLLRNIREAPRACEISCNAGVVAVALIGDLPGYPAPVWYCPSGIANILSLHLVNEHCRVQYDSFEAGRAFHVTESDGSTRDFKPSASGLHYCETDEDDSDNNDDDNSYDPEPHPVERVDYNDDDDRIRQ
jgi:hypothetical protein